MLLHALGSRLPLDAARLVLEPGASTTIHARARGLPARHAAVSSASDAFEPTSSLAPQERKTSPPATRCAT